MEGTSNKPVVLTQADVQDAVGKEFLQLCQQIIADGALTKEEVITFYRWLQAHSSTSIPAIQYLHRLMDRIAEDRQVTQDELDELLSSIRAVVCSVDSIRNPGLTDTLYSKIVDYAHRSLVLVPENIIRDFGISEEVAKQALERMENEKIVKKVGIRYQYIGDHSQTTLDDDTEVASPASYVRSDASGGSDKSKGVGVGAVVATLIIGVSLIVLLLWGLRALYQAGSADLARSQKEMNDRYKQMTTPTVTSTPAAPAPSTQPSSQSSTPDWVVKGHAFTLVKNRLRAPSTCRLVRSMILEKSVTGTTQYFLVSVTVDAQNAYGAMLRGSYIVVLNFRDNSYDAYSNPTFCVSSYDGEEPTEEEKKIFKTMNGWPKLADSATQPTTTPE